MLLLESTSQEDREVTNNIVFLPVLDGDLRSSLQGNSSNELEVYVETGDPSTVASESLKAVFINYGSNPFDLMKESMKILDEYLGTFTVRESKQESRFLTIPVLTIPGCTALEVTFAFLSSQTTYHSLLGYRHLHKVELFSFHPAMNYRRNVDYSSLDP
ncbi:hypothetical protein AgCh_016972 [Apium graveolens]